MFKKKIQYCGGFKKHLIFKLSLSLLLVGLVSVACLQINDKDLKEAHDDKNITDDESKLEFDPTDTEIDVSSLSGNDSDDSTDSNNTSLGGISLGGSSSDSSSSSGSSSSSSSSGTSTSTSASTSTTSSDLPKSFVSASTLTPGSATSGDSDDVETVYQVVATNIAMIVRFEHDNEGDSSSNFTVNIYDSEENQLDTFNANAGIDASLRLGVTKDSTYFIQVLASAAGSDQGYSLTTRFFSSSLEKEPNGSFDTASSLTFGSSVSGRANVGDSLDYYQFTASERPFTLELSHTSSGQSDSDFSVILYDKNQNVLGSFNAEDGNTASQSFSENVGQVYYVAVVVSNAATTREYTLLVD